MTPYLVIPAYDEAPNVERLFARLRPVVAELGARVIFVDDGSRDGTAELAEQAGHGMPLTIVRHGVNKGLGAALDTGLRAAAAAAAPGDAIVTLEADTTSDLNDLPEMLRRFAEGYDLVLASVHAPGGRIVGVAGWRVAASKGLSGLWRVVGGLRHVHTVSAVYRVYRAELVQRALDAYGDQLILESGFAVNVELLLKLEGLGARICEVPTVNDWTHRAGASKLNTRKTLQAYGRLFGRHLTGRLKPPAASGSLATTR